MKKVLKILGVTFFVVVYCFAVSSSLLNSSSSFIKTSDAGNTISIISANLTSPSSQSEGSVEISCPPIPNFKNPFNEFSAITQTTEHIIANEFNQYRFSSRNFLIRFQKVDIIFPFHYFW